MQKIIFNLILGCTILFPVWSMEEVSKNEKKEVKSLTEITGFTYSNKEIKTLDRGNSYEVLQNEIVLMSKNNPLYSYIYTPGLLTCIGIILETKESIVLGHLDGRPMNYTFSKVIDRLKQEENSAIKAIIVTDAKDSRPQTITRLEKILTSKGIKDYKQFHGITTVNGGTRVCINIKERMIYPEFKPVTGGYPEVVDYPKEWYEKKLGLTKWHYPYSYPLLRFTFQEKEKLKFNPEPVEQHLAERAKGLKKEVKTTIPIWIEEEQVFDEENK